MALLVRKTGESYFEISIMAAFSKIRNAETSTKTILVKFTTDFDVVVADSSICACSVCVNLSLVGKAKITKLFIWKKVGSLPKVTLPSKRVTLLPGLPCPPSQLCNFSYKQFAAIYKETYEKLSRPGWLGMEGNPLTRDNSLPYKQAHRIGRNICCM